MKIDPTKIPRHIAIIMDGNGRWAKKRGLPRIAGHREGTVALEAVLKAAADIGVKYLTVFAFSTENWRRPKDEVVFILNLFAEMIECQMAGFMANEVKVNFLGRLNQLPPKLKATMVETMKTTSKNKKITFNIMVNYGGRAELVDAFKQMAKDKLKPAQITEKTVAKYLYTKGIPDPELLIRTASELRVSNFLLWQIAYSELYVAPVLWPEFKGKQLRQAIAAYQKRTRKFGQTEEQVKNKQ